MPESVNPSSHLDGAANFALQQDDICGSADTSDHGKPLPPVFIKRLADDRILPQSIW